jgi:hypothetical protein
MRCTASPARWAHLPQFEQLPLPLAQGVGAADSEAMTSRVIWSISCSVLI